MNAPFTSESLLEALARERGVSGARRVVGRKVEFHATIESTNDRARELAAAGEPEGLVVVADEQTKGRGRGGRGWHSPRGAGIYLSVLLRPGDEPARAPLFGLMASVAVAAGLARHSAAPVHIEWPNDVVIEETPAGRRRKLAGILPESRTGSDRIRDLVIGIGINANQGPEDFPEEIAGRATSLRILGGACADRVAVAVSVLTAVDDWYNLMGREGAGPMLAAFRSMALDLEGRRVRVTGGSGPWPGTTAGLTDDGSLRVRPDGAARPVEVRYGDVLRVEEA